MNSHIVLCPMCSKRFRIHTEKLPEGVNSFNCKQCGSLVNIKGAAKEPSAAQPQDSVRTVLVVLDEAELSKLVGKILSRGSLGCRIANSGGEALELVERLMPAALLVNVVLPDMMGYEFIERLRRLEKGKDLSVIFLSSLHHGTRFKRAPTSLYGADDYIERHHLPDLLIPKLHNLFELGPQAHPLDADKGTLKPLTDVEVDERREIERIHEGPERAGDDPPGEDIRRMARVIAGDIVLYNEDIIRAISLSDAVKALTGDIQEGRSMLAERFPDFEEEAGTILSDEVLKVLESAGVTDHEDGPDGS